MRILAPLRAKRVLERSLYRVREGRGLSPIGRLLTAAALVAVGCSAGGCSLGTFGKEAKKDDLSDVTGSIGPIIRSHDDTNLTDADLALARNAASDVLTSGQKDVSQPWENPETGARGSVTPLASTYTNEGRICRDFLASYVRGANEGWLQGAACRDGKGEAWEIRNMKPWKRS
ncbi:MAG: RT0821/Lpp0805 family surface protein [Afipia sp.]